MKPVLDCCRRRVTIDDSQHHIGLLFRKDGYIGCTLWHTGKKIILDAVWLNKFESLKDLNRRIKKTTSNKNKRLLIRAKCLLINYAAYCSSQ
jgi:hypothetical protein